MKNGELLEEKDQKNPTEREKHLCYWIIKEHEIKHSVKYFILYYWKMHYTTG